MKYTGKIILLFAFLVPFSLATLHAQGREDKSKKDKPTARGAMHVFGSVKDWKLDSTKTSPAEPYARSGDEKLNIALGAEDPVVGEENDFFRFVVVPGKTGKSRDFFVSGVLDGRDHLMLVSEETFSDAKGYYFQFGPTELGKLKKGKHVLMLVIDPYDKTIARSDRNQYSVSFTVQ